MKKIDARGLDCPKPVIKTKKVLEKHGEAEVLVDNEVAAENVKKLGIKMGAKVTKVKENEGNYKLVIADFKKAEKKRDKEGKEKVIFIKSNLLGEGEAELGDILIRGFINTLKEIEPLPNKIIFMNSGVKLPCENDEVINSLKELENKGVDVLTCGTCLDYYNLEDKLKVGNISNMYEIVDSLNQGDVLEI
ncbi:MAG: sulfurtransferase-like selenium metabolism protein YedF [Halanaerobiales bacterium]|nr:sulfurtransferase-like selenium metabolism protein YedF [Halanaerobiales bacterium]